MAHIVTLEKAVELLPGITRHELYTGLRLGKYPGYRAGSEHGRWLVDVEMLEARIQELMQENIKKELDKGLAIGQLRKVRA